MHTSPDFRRAGQPGSTRNAKQELNILLYPFEQGTSVFYHFPGIEEARLPSNLFAAPSAALEVPPCQGNKDDPVNMFGKPAQSYIRLKHDKRRNKRQPYKRQA